MLFCRYSSPLVELLAAATAAASSFAFRSLWCLATACCALLRLMWPSFARDRISSSIERLTVFETICFSFCCSANLAFFAWIGAPVCNAFYPTYFTINTLHICKLKIFQMFLRARVVNALPFCFCLTAFGSFVFACSFPWGIFFESTILFKGEKREFSI